MLLAIDVSNRQTAVALFHPDQTHTWWLTSDQHRTADELGVMLDALLRRVEAELPRLTGIVIGSVVPGLTRNLAEACRRYLGHDPLIVGPGVRTGVRVRTDNPREVGSDRIANALAAYRRYGGPAIVVDFGTATTFDAISAEGDYLGSIIAPGLEMAAGALAHRTAQLRAVDLRRPDQVIGKNTAAAIRSGLVFGFAALVDGIVARLHAELGSGPVIATGAELELIRAESRLITVVDPMLTLDGLRLIWELNPAERTGGLR